MSSKSTEEHRQSASDLPPIRFAILTISDTRTPETDKSGALMRKLIEEDGHTVASYEILKDEPDKIRKKIESLTSESVADVIVTNGGTGISRRDGTFEAVQSAIERELPGFGELFRMLSWNEVGSAAMLSRAAAGIVNGSLLFSTPGSPNAVQVAMEKLILPEIKHLVMEMKK